MPRWLLVVLLVVAVGVVSHPAHAVPPPPAAERAAWEWAAVPVHHDLDPQRARAHPPYVPADTPHHTGPVVVEPGRAVLVWIEAFGSVRVRVHDGRGRLAFARLQPGVGHGFARLEEPGVRMDDGTWWLRSVVGRGEPWLVESDRRIELVVERPVPRRGAQIWEHVHDATMAWIEGEGSLPQLPAGPGSEQYLRRRLADRQLAEDLRRLPGHDADVERAITAWRLERASLELDGLRALVQLRDVRPAGATAIALPHLQDDAAADAPDEPSEAELVRLSTPWSFRVRGPSVLRLGVRALLPPAGPSSQPLEVLVTTRGDDGERIVVARLDALAVPLRVRDPAHADEPIPVLLDAVADTGERVSKEHVLAVPLRPGRHEYQVESRRGEVAIHAQLGRVLPRAHARDAAQWRERTRDRALASIADHVTPAARVARALLADPWRGPIDPPEALDLVPRARALLELEALARRDMSGASRAEQVERIARRLARRPRPDALDIQLRVRAFEQLLAAGRPSAAVEVLRDHARWLDGDELPALVAAAPGPDALGPLAGALDVVAQRAPLTARLRAAYVRLWTWTRWSRLRPLGDAPAWAWIELPSPAAAPDPSDAPGRLSQLPRGQTVEVDALPHPFERDRTPVLRVLARASAAVDGVLALEVDGQRWSAPMHGAAEVLEVVVPVGRHAVRLDAPAGVDAFVNVPIVQDPSRPAGPPPVLTTMWPAQWNERPVRFELGALPRDALAEVDVRVVGTPPHAVAPPVELWVCFDDGTRRKVRVVPGPSSQEPRAVTAPAASSERIRFVVPVPERATQLWIEPLGTANLAVSAKLRRWELPAATTERARAAPRRERATPAGPATDEPATASAGASTASLDPYERLAESTRRLAAEPASASLRLEHAHRLLDAGDSRRARRELVAVLQSQALAPSDPLLPAIRTLAARIDAFIDDDFVELGPLATSGPLLLRPAVAALEPSDPTRAAVLEATAAAHDGRGRKALELHARAYAKTGALGPGYAAVLTYAALLADAPPDRLDPELARLQPLVYGLTTQVRRTLDTPLLRRIHHHVADATRWEPQRMAERSAGTRVRGVELVEVERTDAERLQWALLAPPWSPTETRLLRAGTQAVIQLELPQARELELEAFCDDLEPASPTAAPASLAIRTGNEAASSERTLATPARTLVRERLSLPAGFVRLELELPGTREEQRCAVRWALVEPGASLPTPQRPKRWLLAAQGSPVETIVLGPTTLQLELEPVDAGPPATATVELAGLDGEEPRTLAVTSAAPATLLVPEPGPRRVVIRTADGEVLVGLALRHGAGIEHAPATGAREEDARRDEPRMAASLSLGPAVERSRILWPAGTDARPFERIGAPIDDHESHVGAFEVALGYSHTDIAETDAPRPRDQLRGSLLWRRELLQNRIWVKLAGHSQWRDEAGSAGGGGAIVHTQLGPRRLRASASAAAWSERHAGAPAWSLRASLDVDRPLGLTPTVALVPFVTTTYVHQSLDEPDVAPAVEPTHPQVYSPYLEDHPLAITPGIRVRWFPFQDLQLAGEVSTTPNSDLATIDHVDAGLELQGIASLRVPLLVRYGGAYAVSLRLADEDRDQTFLRHGPRIDAGLTYVIGRLGRLNLDVRDTLYLARPFAARNGVDVVISFELTLGRGIRDTAPMEKLFRPQYRYQWWQPAPAARAP